MAPRNPVKRITAALSDLEAARWPAGRLDAARRLREAAEELEAHEVEAARQEGATWTEIGACYGLTKQGAQQRFRAIRAKTRARAEALSGAAASAAAHAEPPRPARHRRTRQPS